MAVTDKKIKVVAVLVGAGLIAGLGVVTEAAEPFTASSALRALRDLGVNCEAPSATRFDFKGGGVGFLFVCSNGQAYGVNAPLEGEAPRIGQYNRLTKNFDPI